MNKWMSEHGDVLRAAIALRDKLLMEASNAELAYKLPGMNPTLGELFRELGEVQQSYIDGLKTFKQDFTYRHPEPDIAHDGARLKAWFSTLDAEIDAAAKALSDEDLGKVIVRPHWEAPAAIMLHTYRECFLIFAAKATVYFRALNKPLPDQVLWWMG